jgi:cyclopropane fatty-acyl-phospholipid synthase-like methyltransferase
MDLRQYAPAAARNREPILAVLRRALPADAKVLEIASGSGEHAIYFARAMPGLDWRPSDPEASARDSIAAWIDHDGAANVGAPLALDVREVNWNVEADRPFDAVVSINMIHIAPWETALGLIAGAARVLRTDGVLFLYGPFIREGRHTAPSNEAFDMWLKNRDPSFGVRDLADVEAAATAQGIALREIVEMPANNLSLVFAKTG